MIKAFRKRFNIAVAVASVTYKEWSAYRTHSMVSILVGPIYFIVQYFIWTAVYSGKDSINGMSLSAMLTYFGASALIGYLTMDFADWNLQMLIRTGKFLTFALRPIHHRYFALCQKIGHRILGFLFEFIPCFLILAFVFKINLIPVHLFWTVISIALAYFMTFYIHYIIGMCGFWFTQTSAIRSVYYMAHTILSGALIPLVFFPQQIQKALLFLPFQYTAYVPAMICTGEYKLAGMTMPIPQIVMYQAVAVVAVMLFSELIYRLSIRHFSGVGA